MSETSVSRKIQTALGGDKQKSILERHSPLNIFEVQSMTRTCLFLLVEYDIYIPEFLKTGLVKIRAHFTTWQLKAIKSKGR